MEKLRIVIPIRPRVNDVSLENEATEEDPLKGFEKGSKIKGNGRPEVSPGAKVSLNEREKEIPDPELDLRTRRRK